jgi:hypothetical protein
MATDYHDPLAIDRHVESGRVEKLVLVTGFLALAGGVAVAHATPATAYELSLFRGTPEAAWAGLAVAAAAGAYTLLSAPRDRIAGYGVALVWAVVAAFVAMPVVRNYRLFGLADALTHLGWARKLAIGRMEFAELIYPGGHTTAVFVAELGGLPVSRALMLTVVPFVLVYLVFVTLVVRVITTDRRATLVAAVSAAFLLPVNTVSMYIRFFPYALASFFFPLVVYLLFLHVTNRTYDDRVGFPATNFVLPVTLLAILFFHPQVTANVVAILSVVLGIQLYFRLAGRDHPIASHRLIYVHVAFLLIVFLLWNEQHSAMYDHIGAIDRSLRAFRTGTSEAGAVVQQHARSPVTETLGVSLLEVFAKVFLLSAVYGLLVVGLVFRRGAGRLSSVTQEAGAVTYIFWGGVALFPIIVVSFFGDVSSFVFRHLGFGTVLITILGAVAIHELSPDVDWSPGRAGRVVGTLAVVFLLAFALTGTINSPYIYKANHHGSDQMMDGYRTAFENSHGAVEFVGVRYAPERFAEAMPRTEPALPLWAEPNRVPGRVMAAGNLTRWVDEDRYLVVLRAERRVEVELYEGAYHTREGFRRLEYQPGVHRVQTNGGHAVYYVDAADAPATGSESEPAGSAADVEAALPTAAAHGAG